MKMLEVKGINTVIRNLGRATGELGRKVAIGLTKGGNLLQRESMKIVPEQLGHLKGSSFHRNVGGSGFRTDRVVGYEAEYAVFVHEDLNKAHGREFNIKHASEIAEAAGTKAGTAAGGMFFRGENQQAKFLEKPAREKRREIIRIIQREARI